LSFIRKNGTLTAAQKKDLQLTKKAKHTIYLGKRVKLYLRDEYRDVLFLEKKN